MTIAWDQLVTARPPLSSYGRLEAVIRGLREHRPLDLNAERWRRTHPTASFADWQAAARRCLSDGLHYDPGALDLRAEVLERHEREAWTLEKIAFNTTPWMRVTGYLLLPRHAPRPLPAIVLLHAWGGPMYFGKERVVSLERDHPVLAEHRRTYTGGFFLADTFARQGFAVLTIDAFHFGERAPFDLTSFGPQPDLYRLTPDELGRLQRELAGLLYDGVRELQWAGATWAGLNFWDDSRCIDYLLTRPEVDGRRIGCTGLSGGAWRTNMLAALDPRVRAAVSACWMTTGDHQQVYNVMGAVGSFCLLPGVWDRMDIPDLIVLAAPRAVMVFNNGEDPLFPPEGQREAERQILGGYAWAGASEQAKVMSLPKPHCYDAEMQTLACEWFQQHLAALRLFCCKRRICHL